MTRNASPRMRIMLLCLHCCGFTVDSFARETVNSLFDIAPEEANTLRLVDWFRLHEQIVGSEVRNLQMLHPFTGDPVDVFIVKKIFQTKAKPMLIELVSDSKGLVEPLIITKFGDDLRVDLLVMTMFRVFNALWVNYSYMFKYGQLPYIVTYGVLPFSNEKGVIEAVANAEPLASHKWEFIDKHRTVSSAIGCFIGGYMLGVRDRHEDNMLFKRDTREILHIDFGYLFDAQTKMFDAPRVAIPSGFKSVLMDAQLWDGPFVENGVIAWQILRLHQKQLTQLCENLFLGTHPNCGAYMAKEAFLSSLNEDQANERIKFLLENGPKSWKRLAKVGKCFLLLLNSLTAFVARTLRISLASKEEYRITTHCNRRGTTVSRMRPTTSTISGTTACHSPSTAFWAMARGRAISGTSSNPRW